MSQERDLRLGDIDDLPMDDDKSPRRSPAGGSGGGNGGGKGGGKSPRKPSGRPSTGALPQGNVWMIVALVLLALLLVLSAFFYRELVTVRGQMDAELARSTEQLGRLSAHLSATDETLVQSADKVQDTLDMHMSEIRKLWAVSNERNRGWIEDNQKAIKSVQDQRGQLQRSLEGVRGEVSTLKEQLAGVRRDTERGATARNQLQTRVELAMESVQRMENELASQERTLQQISQSLPQLRKLAELEQQGAGVGARLKEIEAAIGAFDAYRREVNNRLDRIEGRP